MGNTSKGLLILWIAIFGGLSLYFWGRTHFATEERYCPYIQTQTQKHFDGLSSTMNYCNADSDCIEVRHYVNCANGSYYEIEEIVNVANESNMMSAITNQARGFCSLRDCVFISTDRSRLKIVCDNNRCTLK